MAISAQNLIDMARQRADFVSSTFLTDSTELLTWASESYKELWDIITEAYGEDYVLSTADIATSSGSITLSAGLYKLVRVDRAVNGIRIPMRRFEYADAVLDDTTMAWGTLDVKWAFTGAGLMTFQPLPDVSETVRIYYVPRVVFSALSDTIYTQAEPWAEYIVVDLAIKMRVKEESDTADLRMDKAELKRRIVSAATPRAIGSPHRAIDVRSLDEGDIALWDDYFV